MSDKDTVEVAAGTPEQPQPFAELGLTAGEYAKIKDILGRRPTAAELALYSVMWSEHCSYKSSKVHLKRLAPNEEQARKLLAGIGANAGVVDIGQGYAVTFKIESHNHPSFVEPHQGAATGVGGIVRDILAMGARPVAVMDALRFGPADAHDTARVLPGVVSGISFYGNCLGLPNIGGELAFDPCYAGNPLVNALCVGVMRHEDLKAAVATGPGNKVVLFGSRTGPDGVGGASVLASATFGSAEPGSTAGDDGGGRAAKRPSVQVGDPFMEKLLVECCLELYAAELVEGIQDLGAAGIACATTELAAGGEGGMRVDLDDVPLRDPSLTPAEILMSESQERMMAVVTPGNVAEFLRVCAKWDVEATVIGEVTGDGTLTMTWRGGTVVRIPPRTAADGPGLPAADDPPRGPGLAAGGGAGRPGPPQGRPGAARDAAGPARLRRRGGQELGHRSSTTTTSAATPCSPCRKTAACSASTSRPGLGIALATDGNGRYCRLDPYQGTQLALSRGVPQRRDDRRHARGGDQLPELRLPGGSPGHVAARRGGPRPCRRLRSARHPGHRRQRQPVQPDRRQRHPPHPGNRRARRPRRRQPPSRRRIHHRRGPGGAAGRHPRGVRRLRVGSRHPPASGRPPPSRQTFTPNVRSRL